MLKFDNVIKVTYNNTAIGEIREFSLGGYYFHPTGKPFTDSWPTVNDIYSTVVAVKDTILLDILYS